MSVKVDFSANDAGFTSTIRKIDSSMKGMDDGVKRASSSVSTSFGSMVKAGAALAIGFGVVKLAVNAISGTMGEFKAALDLGGELNDLSARTGETAGNLMILQRAFDNAGAGADKVGPTINKLQKFMEESSQGITANVETLDRLGISYEELKGKAPLEQMKILSERISAIEDPAERATAAMQIFGRSGGELLPLLTSFSGEVENASAQLGSMPGVMDRTNKTFDAISDNLKVINGKFREFAAGLLEKIAPALELVTTLLSRLDAAAIGMKLGDVITGASNAMGGFSDALAAIKLGEFGLAWDLAWSSIKLQAADSINSIYANVRATAASISALLSEMFRPESPIMNIITSAFEILAAKIVIILSNSLAAIMEKIPGIGKAIAEGMGDAAANAEGKIAFHSQRIGREMENVGTQFKDGIDKAGEAFDETLKTSKELIDTTGLEIKLQEDKTQLLKAQQQELAKQVAEEEKRKGTLEEVKSLETDIGGARKVYAEQVKQLESEIQSARAQGNVELEKELKSQKTYFAELERSLGQGKTMEEAITAAIQAQNLAREEKVQKEKAVNKELKEQLTLSEKMAADIAAANAANNLDKGGRRQGKFQEAMAEGNLVGAGRAQRGMERAEQDQLLNDAFNGGRAFGKSVQDMAKEQGIDTFGKTSKDLRKELAARAKERQGEMAPGKEGKKGDVPGEVKPERNNPLDEIKKAVDAIQRLVEKIEPKLPTHALGV